MTYPITKETISKSIFIVEKTSGEKAAQQMPASSGEITDEELLTTLQQQYPEQYNALMNMPEQQRAATLAQIRGQAGGQGGEFETQEVRDI